MSHPLLCKLKLSGYLTEEDERQLLAAIGPSREVKARIDLVREGDQPQAVQLVLSGLICCYKDLPEGERQILSLLIPGDFSDLHATVLGSMDHSIRTMTPCVLAELSPSSVDQLSGNPRITRALWWATLVAEAVLRRWLINMGQRTADQQMAHLLSELLLRFRAAGQAHGDEYPLAISQSELGEVLGISSVHVNRTLMDLREQGLLRWKQGVVHVPDFERLASYAGFDASYLHFDRWSDKL